MFFSHRLAQVSYWYSSTSSMWGRPVACPFRYLGKYIDLQGPFQGFLTPVAVVLEFLDHQNTKMRGRIGLQLPVACMQLIRTVSSLAPLATSVRTPV